MTIINSVQVIYLIVQVTADDTEQAFKMITVNDDIRYIQMTLHCIIWKTNMYD